MKKNINKKKKILNSIKWSSYSSIIVAIIQFISVIVLALFLKKVEMGQIAIIQTVVGITIIFLDMGISNAVVHKPNISKLQLSSVYWVNIFSGIFFTIIVFFSAKYISNFYNSIELDYYIKIISLTFIITSISRLYKFLFLKQLLLKRIAISEILSYLFSFIGLVLMLYLNFGVLAFVYSIIIRTSVQSLYLFVLGKKMFSPSLVYNHKSLKELFSYGLFNLGQNLTVYFNSQLDVLLIGKLLGVEVLGVYSVAKVLASKPLQLISPVVSKVTFPLMSEVQFDNNKLKDIYITSVKYLFSVVLLIYVVMMMESTDLIHIIYNQKWNDSIVLLQLLTLLFIVNAIGNPIGSLILASGRVELGFYWNLVMLLLIPVVIYFSSLFGIEQIIISLIIFQTISLYFSFKLITSKILVITLKELVYPIFKILMMIIPTIFSIFVLQNFIDNEYIRIIGLSTFSIFTYFYTIFIFNRPYFNEIKNNLVFK